MSLTQYFCTKQSVSVNFFAFWRTHFSCRNMEVKATLTQTSPGFQTKVSEKFLISHCVPIGAKWMQILLKNPKWTSMLNSIVPKNRLRNFIIYSTIFPPAKPAQTGLPRPPWLCIAKENRSIDFEKPFVYPLSNWACKSIWNFSAPFLSILLK